VKHKLQTAEDNGSRAFNFAFFMPNSRNLAFLKVFRHEAVLFGFYVIIWQAFGIFRGVERIHLLFDISEEPDSFKTLRLF